MFLSVVHSMYIPSLKTSTLNDSNVPQGNFSANAAAAIYNLPTHNRTELGNPSAGSCLETGTERMFMKMSCFLSI